jgi:hypothetical protein
MEKTYLLQSGGYWDWLTPYLARDGYRLRLLCDPFRPIRFTEWSAERGMDALIGRNHSITPAVLGAGERGQGTGVSRYAILKNIAPKKDDDGQQDWLKVRDM